MRRLFLLVLGISALRLSAAIPFPQAASDLAPDPAARFGTLPNGIRYVLLPNREPRNRASLRLLVLSGSLEEKDGQRGLAHFLEHMAFNGSTHNPPGTLVEYFQRLGMSFGGDTNAYTDFDHTAYEIELPDTQPGTVAKGLQVFADFAGGLLLRPEMITKERPIILSEKRTRDSVGFREFVASYDFELAGTLFPQRIPIGLQPVIEQAQRDRFLDLYNTWYRPERMAVIVVGNIEPDAVERQIADAFGGVSDRSPAPPEPDLGHVTLALGLQAGYHAEPDAPSTDVTIDVVAPYRYLPDTASLRLRHLARDLAQAMLNRRLTILAKTEGAPFIRGNVSIGEYYNFYRDAGIDITCAPGQWQAALGVAEQELRRALEYGFTRAELDEAVANVQNDLRQAASNAPTRRSEDLANEIVQTLVEKSVFTAPTADLALYGPALAKITPDDCSNALRVSFGAPGRYVMVIGNARVDGDARAAIVAAFQRSRSVAVKPPLSAAREKFAYADFGPPGKIATQRHVPDLDVTEALFANGVRANVKRTEFEDNRIHVSVRVGAGKLTSPRAEPGLPFFTDLTFLNGGLGRHSMDDLQRIFAGRTVALSSRSATTPSTFPRAPTGTTSSSSSRSSRHTSQIQGTVRRRRGRRERTSPRPTMTWITRSRALSRRRFPSCSPRATLASGFQAAKPSCPGRPPRKKRGWPRSWPPAPSKSELSGTSTRPPPWRPSRQPWERSRQGRRNHPTPPSGSPRSPPSHSPSFTRFPPKFQRPCWPCIGPPRTAGTSSEGGASAFLRRSFQTASG